MAGTVKLYAVAWTDGKPEVVSCDAVETARQYAIVRREERPDTDYAHEYRVRSAFKYQRIVHKSALADEGFGLTPVDAIHATLVDEQRRRDYIKESLVEAERQVTELAVLGLATAGVGAEEAK